MTTNASKRTKKTPSLMSEPVKSFLHADSVSHACSAKKKSMLKVGSLIEDDKIKDAFIIKKLFVGF